MKTDLLAEKASNRYQEPVIMKPFSKSGLEFYLAINNLEKKLDTLGKHTHTTEKFT